MRTKPVARRTAVGLGVATILVTLLLFRPVEFPRSIQLVSSPKEGTLRAYYVVPTHEDQNLPLMHYTEHLVWQNTFQDTQRKIDRHSNAWTNHYTVGYWLSGPKEELPELLATLSRVFDSIEVPRNYADEERDIVLREYDYRLTGNLDAQAEIKIDAFLYEGNAISASVIGTPEEISTFDYEEAKQLHAATHRLENAVLIVVGDVSKRQVQRAVRKLGLSEQIGSERDTSSPQFDLAQSGQKTLRFEDANAAPRMIWRRVVTLDEPMQFDLLEAHTALLSDILSTSLPGGLAEPLRYDAAIARGFDIHVWPLDEDNIEISIAAEPDQDVSLQELRRKFEDTLASIAVSGIPVGSYTRVLKRFESYWPRWNDENETAEWMADYVLDRISHRREPLSERELKKLHDQISHEQLNLLLLALTGSARTATAFIDSQEIPE